MTTDTLPIQYGIMLSKEQLDFLADDRQGFHRMKAFDTFVQMASFEPRRYSKPGFSVSLTVGQFAVSTVELASLWRCDRKTAMKVVQMFNQVGILPSETNNRTTVHTLLCIAFWYIGDAKDPLRNPHYVRQNLKLRNADAEEVSDVKSNTLSASGSCASPSSNDTTLDSQSSPCVSNPVSRISDSREEKLTTDGQLENVRHDENEAELPEELLTDHADIAFDEDGEVIPEQDGMPPDSEPSPDTKDDASADADGCKPFSNENVTQQNRGVTME